MRHIGLFEGIGGFSLAARWMGWETIAWCEWNEFGQKVLKHHFPESEGYGDITKSNFTKYANTVDIVTGGFPCQPYSAAGKRLGKEDDRHLWPEMLRAIKEIQPSWVVGENVPGLLNWNAGVVLNEIKTDLESAGFEVFPPCVLPACGVNAPHRRDRVWIIAYSKSNFSINGNKDDRQNTQAVSEKRFNECSSTTNPNKIGLSDQEEVRELERRGFSIYDQRNQFDISKIEPGVCRGDDGFSKKLDENRLMALGNAIVPQVAFQIFKAIEQYENDNK